MNDKIKKQVNDMFVITRKFNTGYMLTRTRGGSRVWTKRGVDGLKRYHRDFDKEFKVYKVNATLSEVVD